MTHISEAYQASYASLSEHKPLASNDPFEGYQKIR